MAIVRLVRHGEAAASYDQHPDPGLSQRGRAQAQAAAEQLAPFGPLAIVSSPMARARETAAPAAERWAAAIAIDPDVSEIPSPGLSPRERGPWLQTIMAGTWDETTAEIRDWRDGVAAAVLAFEQDTVVFSHFVAINAAIAVAIDSSSPRCRHLDHCSITTFDTSKGRLELLDAGAEGATEIL